jgi:hypothetical protein
LKNDRTMKTIAEKVRKFRPPKVSTSQTFLDLPNLNWARKA